ncbi:uncharacterized protein LOC111637648 [Centruroides sculpturatus]|uniref:uncharacterized protein LOC111637648 n=1 Tax=Centruroides sculpturatus TaxID=218467 RepID=UPI000C6DF0CD|nr:uncharacterized protein LOC111637648 [Centruroides sculpturatus]XP_023238959.1 uncharacterized protein LOC111637648 [Centruroides sculpturatus]
MGRKKPVAVTSEEPSRAESEEALEGNANNEVPPQMILNQTVVISSEKENKKKPPTKRKKEEKENPPVKKGRVLRGKKKKDEEEAAVIGATDNLAAEASNNHLAGPSITEVKSVGTNPIESMELIIRSHEELKRQVLDLSNDIKDFKSEVLGLLRALIDQEQKKEEAEAPLSWNGFKNGLS